ncbi:hypothetical protein GF337_09195 [candidate division KSB1 bacterium]|nr:hypothetical protein [candidate division KSB1 bacterium]
MSKEMTIKDALQLAIDEEIKAYNLYNETSQKVKNSGARKMLVELANEELKHREALEKIITNDDYKALGNAIDRNKFGIAEFLEETQLKETASIQEILIFAIKEEEKALNFYNAMKLNFPGTDMQEVFGRLAAEEMGHKQKLEREYEEHILREN